MTRTLYVGYQDLSEHLEKSGKYVWMTLKKYPVYDENYLLMKQKVFTDFLTHLVVRNL